MYQIVTVLTCKGKQLIKQNRYQPWNRSEPAFKFMFISLRNIARVYHAQL